MHDPIMTPQLASHLTVDPTSFMLDVDDWQTVLLENASEIEFVWPFIVEHVKDPAHFRFLVRHVPFHLLETLPFDRGKTMAMVLIERIQKKEHPEYIAAFSEFLLQADGHPLFKEYAELFARALIF